MLELVKYVVEQFAEFKDKVEYRVDKTSIHMFRHTFARKYLLDCGGNAFTLQKLLGHATLEMTKKYCAIFNADIANGYDNLSPLEQLSSNNAKLTMPKKKHH